MMQKLAPRMVGLKPTEVEHVDRVTVVLAEQVK